MFLDQALLGVKPILPWSKICPIIVSWYNFRPGINPNAADG